MCSLCCLCTSPVTPISNWPSVRPTAAPRFESRRCDLCQSRGEDKPDSPTISKWQIGLGQWMKPYRGGAGTAGGAKRPPRGVPRGDIPSGRFFGDFLIGEKVTRGGGAERRGWGVAPPRIGRSRGPRPCKISPGAEAPPFYKNPASKQNIRCGIEKTINPPSVSGQSSKKINTLCPR